MKFDESKPIYLQIIELIFELILKKKWQQDSRIPSIRELASELEVNPNTIAKAYTECENIGIIYNLRGKGYFLDKDAYAKVLEYKKNLFIKNDIPKILKELNILNISFNEFVNLLEKCNNKHIENI